METLTQNAYATGSEPKEALAVPSGPVKAQRNLAVDTYRGFVMLLMMAEILQLSRVARALPGNAFWSFLAHHQTHVQWAGCSLHDTIQPGFSFLVGVALPYSIAARLARGGSFRSEFPRAPPDACPVGRLLAARYDPAGLLIPGRSSPAILDRGATGARRILQIGISSRTPRRMSSGPAARCTIRSSRASHSWSE